MPCLKRLILSAMIWTLIPALPASGHLPDRDANLAAATIEQHPGAQVPLELTFRDEHDRRLTFRQAMAGKVTLLLFADYDCPQLCHHVLAGLVTGLQAVSLRPVHDYAVTVVSLDPAAGPSQAQAYKAAGLAGESPDRADGWRFLTSSNATIQALADAVGFGYAYDASQQAYAHGAGLIVLTPGGQVSRYLLGVGFAPQDLRLALLDAAGGTIGSLTDQLVLRCYRYDPTHGRYSLAVMGLVRAIGLLTILLVGGLLWRLGRPGRVRP